MRRRIAGLLGGLDFDGGDARTAVRLLLGAAIVIGAAATAGLAVRIFLWSLGVGGMGWAS